MSGILTSVRGSNEQNENLFDCGTAVLAGSDVLNEGGG